MPLSDGTGKTAVSTLVFGAYNDARFWVPRIFNLSFCAAYSGETQNVSYAESERVQFGRQTARDSKGGVLQQTN